MNSLHGNILYPINLRILFNIYGIHINTCNGFGDNEVFLISGKITESADALLFKNTLYTKMLCRDNFLTNELEPDRISDPGLTLSCPAYFGAVPCVASKIA